MNYIKQLNAYWKKDESDPMSIKLSMMYLFILKEANKCGWKEKFSVPNTTLMTRLKISKSEVFRLRKRLVTMGFVEYQKGSKGNAGKYTIVPLYEDTQKPIYDTYPSAKASTDKSIDIDTPVETKNETEVCTILKSKPKQKKKSKQNSNVFVVAAAAKERLDKYSGDMEHIANALSRAGFDGITEMTMEELASYLDDGMNMECIIYAIEQANSNNVRSLAYVRSILKRLIGDGIKTKDDLETRNNKNPKKMCHKFEEELPEDDYFRLNSAWDEI